MLGTALEEATVEGGLMAYVGLTQIGVESVGEPERISVQVGYVMGGDLGRSD